MSTFLAADSKKNDFGYSDYVYTISKNTQALAKEGINTTSKEFIDLSNEAGKQLSEGVEIVSDAAKDAYEWAEKNACRIAVTTTISVGVVAYFTPKPSPTDPGTITSASMSWHRSSSR